MLGFGEDDLSIYLNDHLAGATAGVKLARRVASGAIAAEIEEDRATLISIMERVGVRQDPAKVALGWAVVQAARVRFAAELLGHAAVSRLEQVEALALGVEGKLALWQALRHTHGSDPRLDGIDLDELVSRARSQRRQLERMRMAAAGGAFVSEPGEVGKGQRMRVVVVGATGNIGTSVLAALTADPKVSSIAAVARRPAEHGDPKVEWHALDVMRDNLDRVMEGAEAVVCLPWLIQPSRDLETVRATNVDGSRRVFEAAGHAGVEALLYSSSVGAYSPGPKDRAVDESWPTRGIQSSFYSRHKAEVERILDGFDSQMRVVRMRPALVFKREAAAEIRRLFAGPFLPSPLLRRRLIPVVPKSGRLRFQAVHSLDVGEAFRLAVHAPVRGAFNLAADPVLDGDELGQALGARPVPVHPGLLRSAADLAWRLRLQPSPPGWVDLALGVPIMSTARARDELGWSPRYSSRAALLELLDGLRDDAGAGTPRLAPDAGGRFRGGELRSGVGAREG